MLIINASPSKHMLMLIVSCLGFLGHLSNVVYVELPKVGTYVAQGKNFDAVESVKAASNINSPVFGEVDAVNEELHEKPAFGKFHLMMT